MDCGLVSRVCQVKDGKLLVKETEAVTVRMIFERFAYIGSATGQGASRGGGRATSAAGLSTRGLSISGAGAIR